MKVLGLDIGTTTVSAVVVENHQVLSSVTLKNESFIRPENSWERIQDPEYIRNTALKAVEGMLAEYPDVERIGVTGQMHGIVYLNAEGDPVSPLYIWQDGRGDLPYQDGKTYAGYIQSVTGYSVATGYGLVTHFYNMKNGLVPDDAVVFCAIHDYIAMILAGLSVPVTEASDAASFGLFNVEQGLFDETALKEVGINGQMLPKLAGESCVGYYKQKIPVFAAIGDNQASFLGATGGDVACMLVNVGTGSQFSVYSESYMNCAGLETRPFPGRGYLLVGASLCGGRAYALMENYIRDIVERIGGLHMESCYSAMDCVLSNSQKPSNLPETSPLFQGTRENPTVRGGISGLSTENFTITHMLWSMLDGMAQELYDMYGIYERQGGKNVKLIGSGNGLRKNKHLQQCFSERFNQQLVMSECNEEAATGAALYAAMAAC